MTSWHPYPSLFALGHKATQVLSNCKVLVQEKIDGSQFSFGMINDELKCKSKGKDLDIDNPENLFKLAVKTVINLRDLLKPGYTYRGEVLSKPKHNTLAYDRTPHNNIIIFDINDEQESYLDPIQLCEETIRIGLELVPTLYYGPFKDMPNDLLDTISLLGGQKIEGYVIKQYEHYGTDKKCIFAKVVSENFKEIHGTTWKSEHPTKVDFVTNLALKYKTEARWNKAIQHLAEAGILTETPKDIGPLIKEIQMDTFKECADEIKDALFEYFRPQITKLILQGFPEFYKDKVSVIV